MEAPDDMPAHVNSTLIGPSVTVPISNGCSCLGMWQGIYLCEHRDSGGWGDGERKFRGQHAGDDAWNAFTDMMARGRLHREETGKPLMVPRYDIVPIPEHLRRNLAPGSVMMFPADTAISMNEFKADDVVGRIAPRPLLLLHSSEDSVTPTEQSIEMFKRAGQPTDLHLVADVDHFMFGEGNPRIISILEDWLARYFPV